MKRSRLVFGGVGLAVVALAVIAIAASGSTSNSKSSSMAYGATATTAPAPVSAPAPAPAPAPAAGAVVRVAHDPRLGDILVAGNGHTVYMFDKDMGTVSACTGPCASTWPVWKTAGAPTGGPGVDASKLGSAHGQVTYAGHLLYFFAADQAAGETNGVGIPSWNVVSPAGFPIGH